MKGSIPYSRKFKFLKNIMRLIFTTNIKLLRLFLVVTISINSSPKDPKIDPPPIKPT